MKLTTQSDPYFDRANCVNKLFETYKKHKKLIIAVDFDCTVSEYPEGCGTTHNKILDILRECNELGFYVIPYTCSRIERYRFIYAFFQLVGIKVEYINENIPGIDYGPGAKLYYNLLLDDKSGLSESYEILKEAITLIKGERNNHIYLEAPECFYGYGFFPHNEWLFLAGSISGAHNWQTEAATKLLPFFNIANPRRANFDVTDPNVEREQIAWEYKHLELCENILFYFSHETVAPITLLEYGTLLEQCNKGEKNIHVAIHPEYPRKNDVLIQTELRAPKLMKNITFSLDTTIQQVIGEKI